MKWLQLRKDKVDVEAERRKDKKTDDLLDKLHFEIDRLESVVDELQEKVDKGEVK